MIYIYTSLLVCIWINLYIVTFLYRQFMSAIRSVHITTSRLYESQDLIHNQPRLGSTATLGDVRGTPWMLLPMDKCACSKISKAFLGKCKNSNPYRICDIPTDQYNLDETIGGSGYMLLPILTAAYAFLRPILTRDSTARVILAASGQRGTPKWLAHDTMDKRWSPRYRFRPGQLSLPNTIV